MQKLNLVGQVFGKLRVVEDRGVDAGKNSLWKCVCTCGGERTIRGVDLRSGKILNCGCIDARNRDIAKQRFGRLVALNLDHIEGNRYLWVFQCDCGNKILLDRASAVSGNTKSCGCLLIEAATKRARKNIVIINEEGSKND